MEKMAVGNAQSGDILVLGYFHFFFILSCKKVFVFFSKISLIISLWSAMIKKYSNRNIRTFSLKQNKHTETMMQVIFVCALFIGMRLKMRITKLYDFFGVLKYFMY